MRLSLPNRRIGQTVEVFPRTPYKHKYNILHVRKSGRSKYHNNPAKRKIKANAPDSATYVVIYGKATGYKFLSWEIYLGATTTTNFNIKRNCNYTYNITLKPTTTDTRVTYKKTALSGQEAIFIGMAASLHLILLYPMIPI